MRHGLVQYRNATSRSPGCRYAPVPVPRYAVMTTPVPLPARRGLANLKSLRKRRNILVISGPEYLMNVHFICTCDRITCTYTYKIRRPALWYMFMYQWPTPVP